MLKKTQRSEAEQNKEQIGPSNTVSRLQEQELKSAATDSDIQMKLQRLKDLETETEELRKKLRNGSQLESTKILANSILEDPETETSRKLGDQLRQENEDLVRKLRGSKQTVYLRWINACLRYELRNLQPPQVGMMEKGNSIMEFEPDHRSSSRASSMTDLGELDDSPSPKTNNSGKTKIFHKLRRLLMGKETHNQSHGSSGSRTRATGDSDSPNGSVSISTPTDPTSDLQSTRGRASSFYLSRQSSHSMDTQRTRSLENSRRNSEAGSSHTRILLRNRVVSIRVGKFAEVLKDPESRAVNGNRMDKLHRKSVSVGSFEALHRSSE
uniref:Uncharacterized protein n=1 Tax=Salix viminalis TaxID=40686 RepID=A0A6N2N2R3_SALVM